MTAPPSLRARSVNAASWSVVQLVISSALRLGSNLILTRLLAPEAFGLVGLSMTVITALTLLSDVGISRSIIRERDGDADDFLQAAWRIKVLRGSAIAACIMSAAILLWLLGPSLAPAGSTYADPALPGLIAATAVIALTSGFGSTRAELAARRMDTRRIVMVQLAGQAVTIVFTILAAVVIPSVWAISIGMILGAVFGLYLSFVAFAGPPMRWNKDPEIARRLWHFGRWIVLSSSLSFLQSNADKLALAGLLGPTAFGHYVIALIWSGAGQMLNSTLMGRIVSPALAEVALSRSHDIPRIYRRMQRLSDAYLFATFLVLHFGAERIIGLLYTDVYADSAHFLKLAAFSLLVARFGIAQELLINLGDSRAIAVASGLRTVALAVLMPLGWIFGGVDGLILASVLNPLVQTPFMLWKVRRHQRTLNQTEDWLALAVVLALVGLLAFPTG